MTALSAAALAVALQCAPIDPDLLQGFATVESAVNPLVIHENIRGTPGHTYTARSVDEAVRIALPLIMAGKSIDTGPFQINSKNLDLLQVSLAETFDTCAAAAAAGRLIEIMSRYNTGKPTAGLGYAKRVIAAVRSIKDNPPSPPAEQPCPRDDQDGWHTVAHSPACPQQQDIIENAEDDQ